MRIRHIIYPAAIILVLLFLLVSYGRGINCGDFSSPGYPYPVSGYCGSSPWFWLLNISYWFTLIFVPIFVISELLIRKNLKLLFICLSVPILVLLILLPIALCGGGLCLKIPLTISNNLDSTSFTSIQFKHGFPLPYLEYENWSNIQPVPKYPVMNIFFSWGALLLDYLFWIFFTLLFLRKLKHEE